MLIAWGSFSSIGTPDLENEPTELASAMKIKSSTASHKSYSEQRKILSTLLFWENIFKIVTDFT